ncbi:hypothetical protein ACFC58_32710 [Kitasatospora purpeofusca]|uniref:hypothetical protein n=1 Tax=Kitasatospora purpeofusca TaxID=67352 RepID=UPI0035DAC7C5
MRISAHYGLNKNQAQLDFVDVDTTDDIAVYIDPSSIRRLEGMWAEECQILLATFFDTVLDAVRHRDKGRVSSLLGKLSEPNETHLGVSRGKSRGRGMGKGMSNDLAEKLSSSQAAQTGLIEELEDTALFIEGVGKDIVSDITTNVIRGALITYTQAMCDFHGIPTETVHSGPVWNSASKAWEDGYTDLPVASHQKLLMVPKVIVRRSLHLSKEDYYRNHLIPVLQDEELDNPASQLVQTAKSGRRFVNRQDVRNFHGDSKPAVVRLSLERPEVYNHYKQVKRLAETAPLTNEQLAESGGGLPPDYDALLEAVLETPAGRDYATTYHHNIEALLSALFYPSLSMPIKEAEIHEGRKRIDIRYMNSSQEGFFRWLRQHHVASQYIFVECKNYSRDVENPELDQISSRFSPIRGKLGILTSRSFKNKDLFLKRCRDTALDHRGFVIALDDDDLQQLVNDVKRSLEPPTPEEIETGDPIVRPSRHEYSLLHERYERLVN